MKKFIWILLALVVGGYFVNSYLEEKATREAERAEAEKIEQATKAAVFQMVLRTDAIDDWALQLSKGERFRFEPILTIELERVWLQDRPILFIGSIKDIATHNQSQYTVLVERSFFGSFVHIFDTELRLSLFSSKEIVDSFLKKHPDFFKNYGFNNGVAVVARIKSIRTINILGEEGEREEVKIGDGELIDIIYTGDALFKSYSE